MLALARVILSIFAKSRVKVKNHSATPIKESRNNLSFNKKIRFESSDTVVQEAQLLYNAKRSS